MSLCLHLVPDSDWLHHLGHQLPAHLSPGSQLQDAYFQFGIVNIIIERHFHQIG